MPRPMAMLLAGVALLAGAPAAAQDTTVVAGPRYGAGPLHRTLWGGAYRDLWTTPVRVPVLNPDTFAGGLRVLEAGGGLATESLRMRGADGREYTFRSVNKTPERGLPPDLRDGPVESIAQDQVANKHPAAALVVEPLLTAVGLLHPRPALYVMPAHPFLGEFRRFAGRLGQVEVRPEDGEEGGTSFAGADRVVGTERLLERLEESPAERLDAREYLTARLMDVLLGDWDRHADQWRWAGYESGDRWRWRTVPRDRDNAFNDNRGLLLAPVRAAFPQLTRFGPRYDDVFGLVIHASDLDRRLLSELEWPAWDSAARFIQQRVTDEAIGQAVRRMPPEYQPLSAPGLSAILRARRDSLHSAARSFYEILASDVDVHATDQAERAEVDRRADGSVELRLYPSPGSNDPYFRRRFLAGETREVRVFLHGGDDHAAARGAAAPSIQVRLIGGGGDDVLADSSSAGARMTVLHDHGDDDRLLRGPGTVIDTREYDPDPPRSMFGNPPAPRDWGSSFAPVAPWAGWVTNVGPILGAGPVWTRYGFRRQPYARQLAVRGLYAPLESGLGVEALADFRRTSLPGTGLRLRAGARNFEVIRFHGLGNDSPEDEEVDYEAAHDELIAEAAWYGRMGRRASYSLGPVVRWRDPRGGHPLLEDVRGGDGLAQAGAAGDVVVDGRDTLPITHRGWWLRAGAAAYGADVGTFGGVDAEARAYLPLGPGPILALRAGGEVNAGRVPFQEAAFLGGYGSLRGYPFQRFAGDAAVFGTAELRQPLGQVRVLVRGRLGVFGFGEAGRVYVDDASPGDWNPSWGGGLWFESLGRVATLTWARGDGTQVYAGLGLPF